MTERRNLLPVAVFCAAIAVSLTGCAAALVGATAVGISAATDTRSVGTQIDDQTIEVRVITALKGEDRLDDSRVQVVSFNRSVLLLGQVTNSSLRDLASHLVRNTQGVDRVHNELKVAPVISIGQISQDTYITSKIKAKFIADDKIKASDIKVVTENGEVALMGFVERDIARQAIDIARNINGVTRVIDAFE
ncbi:division/outer membrane stress-associated lipid-binding lipoprotein [Pseudidiomarina andamanensis]|uniref:Osmotically-inducible protein OsmY n=1 Tax=Pseudidiomarina andamanensis TaxID=1940690 RepID=A0AA92IML2_9GAMM|nr:division/outer membrane stress-associated lipid-binding lipoprotein [Pseudidiomarina andamanensis]MDS0217589.1 division/outer membrane stress-associated lipid-binding lipoprotein [Pseudidiomarina andamanensis]QGT96583.1 osmotically-inducible protein OsmY [Pseudidiomarina andamanensis]